ncbi:MAG: hypothetical protein JWM91_2970 [Rhodospirillales bacterium]|nr:hypothetical protein [Rhodospirillales bacterium]
MWINHVVPTLSIPIFASGAAPYGAHSACPEYEFAEHMPAARRPCAFAASASAYSPAISILSCAAFTACPWAFERGHPYDYIVGSDLDAASLLRHGPYSQLSSLSNHRRPLSREAHDARHASLQGG